MTMQSTSRARRAVFGFGIAAIAVTSFALGTCVAASGPAAGGATASVAPAAASAGAAPHAARKDQLWTCAMHPQIRLHHPGHCPICGMKLIPVQDSGDRGDAVRRITLSPRAKILAQIQTTVVRRASAGATAVRLLGSVDYDENALRTVTAWTGGRIDRLEVRVTGERVRRGQVIARLYSPEVYAAEQDVIASAEQASSLEAAGRSARAAAEVAVQAAEKRLRLLGVPKAEIARVEARGTPSEDVAIRSPFAGTITDRLATEGQYVKTGTPLYRVADLSRLWVQLDAYESDLPKLAIGRAVTLTAAALPGETIPGKVAFVDPVIDPRTRTARVRIEVENRGGALRPGMYVEAVIDGPGKAGESASAAPLVIPKTAPLFTGRRSLVYVAVPNANRPTYEARVVRLGPLSDDVYPVVSGLKAGERVVTQGAFALDADLQIRGGDSMMTMPDDRGRAAAPHARGGGGEMSSMAHGASNGGQAR